MPTNQEFTTYTPDEENTRYPETLFTIDVWEATEGDPWKSKSGHFKLTHVHTKVNLWTHAKSLPDWAFKQQEINGNKNAQDRSATWYVEDIISDESKRTLSRGCVEFTPDLHSFRQAVKT